MTAALQLMLAAALANLPTQPPHVPPSAAQEHVAAGVALRSNRRQARPHFQAAADLYATLRRDAWDSVALHRNEGNARMLAEDLPGAILAYHRGMRLDPDDAGLRAGLAYARSRVNYSDAQQQTQLQPRSESLSWLRPMLRRYGAATLLALTTAGWSALTLWLVFRRRRWLMIAGACLCIALGWSGSWYWEQRDREARPAPAVVIQSTILRNGDGHYFWPRLDLPLPVGLEMEVLGRRGAWTQVAMADGTIGWLPTAAVAAP